MNEQMTYWAKLALTTAAGWAWSVVGPVFPYGIVCTSMVVADVISARRLARRIGRKVPSRRWQLKFNSARFGRVIVSLMKIYGVLILAAMIQEVIVGETFALLKSVAGMICFWQAVSILENESSCNSHPWARILGKVLIDKTERHLGINLDELRKLSEDEDQD